MKIAAENRSINVVLGLIDGPGLVSKRMSILLNWIAPAGSVSILYVHFVERISINFG